MVEYRTIRKSRRIKTNRTRKTVNIIDVDKSDGNLLYNGIKLKKWKITFSPGLLYILRDTSRSYWVLSKVRPSISFDDTTNTSIIAERNKLVLKSNTVYEKIKKLIATN